MDTPPDHARSLLRLMWQPDTKVGRSGLTVGQIVTAAIEIADAGGVDALSMRRLAQAVQVGAMTLYGYVPGRAELIALMLDHVNGTAYRGQAEPGDLPTWRAGCRQVALRTFDHAVAHPWVTEVRPGRPLLGPGTSLRYERELAPLDGIGLDDQLMDHVRTALEGMAMAAARWQVGLDRARSSSGLDDAQWWAMEQPELASAIAGLQLPVASRVGASVASAGAPRDSLEVSVTLLLDGLTARIPPGANPSASGTGVDAADTLENGSASDQETP